MHPALSKGPLFYKTPPFSTSPKHTPFFTFTKKNIFHFYNPPISFPAYGPVLTTLVPVGSHTNWTLTLVSVKIVHMFESFHVTCLFALVDLKCL